MIVSRYLFTFAATRFPREEEEEEEKCFSEAARFLSKKTACLEHKDRSNCQCSGTTAANG